MWRNLECNSELVQPPFFVYRLWMWKNCSKRWVSLAIGQHQSEQQWTLKDWNLFFLLTSGKFSVAATRYMQSSMYIRTHSQKTLFLWLWSPFLLAVSWILFFIPQITVNQLHLFSLSLLVFPTPLKGICMPNITRYFFRHSRVWTLSIKTCFFFFHQSVSVHSHIAIFRFTCLKRTLKNKGKIWSKLFLEDATIFL